ncbi:hypothetical protein IC582_009343 [Cucumis melo]
MLLLLLIMLHTHQIQLVLLYNQHHPLVFQHSLLILQLRSLHIPLLLAPELHPFQPLFLQLECLRLPAHFLLFKLNQSALHPLLLLPWTPPPVRNNSHHLRTQLLHPSRYPPFPRPLPRFRFLLFFLSSFSFLILFLLFRFVLFLLLILLISAFRTLAGCYTGGGCGICGVEA